MLREENRRLREQLETKQAQWEEDMRAALRLRERLDRAEEFIDHLDASYRYEEWLAAYEDEDSIPASEGKLGTSPANQSERTEPSPAKRPT